MELPITTLKEQQSQSFVAFFLSDLHLSPQNQDHIDRLERFIDEVLLLKQPVRIFFLGDVFDLWVGTASPVKKKIQPLLQKLQSLQSKGGMVFFFEGNHDLHLDVYFEKKWQFKVVKDFWQENLQGLTIRLEHGDLFDPEDRGYLFLRRFLRKSWVRFLLTKIIPDRIINAVGNYFSKQSSKNTKSTHKISKDSHSNVEEKLKIYASHQLNEHQADVFICGHTHQRNAYEMSSTQHLINLGTWQGQSPQALALNQHKQFFWIKI